MGDYDHRPLWVAHSIHAGSNDAKGIASVNHTAAFDVDEDALPLGVRALATLAWEFLARER